MTVELHSQVALTCDLPKEGLCRGDVATVVEQLSGTAASGGEKGYALEVFNAVGDTVAVVIVPVSAVEPLRSTEILSVREFSR